MSFGFSAGDFLATARLVKDIIDALQSSSTSDFQELTLELHGLTRALFEIEHLQPLPQEEDAVNAIKTAALVCQHPLHEFKAKIKKYEMLGDVNFSKREQMRRLKLKLQWGLTMEEEVQRLRAYLNIHIASLNTRLLTQGLKSTSVVALDLTTAREEISETHRIAIGIEKESHMQTKAANDSCSLLQRLVRLIQHGVIPRLGALCHTANNIWSSNAAIVDLLLLLQKTILAPDIRHTWFQQPCVFEDGLGRVLPVPAEYDLRTLRAIIVDRFDSRPGYDKVLAGEYELFNATDSTQELKDPEFNGLVPGMNIKMAFVIGFYRLRGKECPKPGCSYMNSTTIGVGGRMCDSCGTWSALSREPIPKPFRFIQTEDVFRKLRSDRKWFKNVKVCLTDFPKLPPASDFRGYWVKATKAQAWDKIATASNPRRENPGVTLLSFEDKSVSIFCTEKSEIIANAVRVFSEELLMPKEDLKEWASKNYEPGTLGVDSLVALSIIQKLRHMDVDWPSLSGYASQMLLVGRDFEMFIRDVVNMNC